MDASADGVSPSQSLSRGGGMVALRCVVVGILLLAAAPALTVAQSVSTVRVVRTAAVLEQPSGEAKPVGTAGTGEILDVLDERPGWYLVRPPAGAPVRDWRTGWVSANTVESMPRSGSESTLAQTPAPMAAATEISANRRGFIIGFGVGAGLHRTPSFSVVDRFGRTIASGGGTNNTAIVTNFHVGWAPSDKALLFYSNRATFTTDESYDALAVTGFGMTYMFRPTSPTMYVTGSVGAGVGANVTSSSSTEVGMGWSAGLGWEFRRHLALEGDILQVRIGNNQNHTVYRGLFVYTFY